jgi:hypothetical protein
MADISPVPVNFKEANYYADLDGVRGTATITLSTFIRV